MWEVALPSSRKEMGDEKQANIGYAIKNANWKRGEEKEKKDKTRQAKRGIFSDKIRNMITRQIT